MLFLGTLDDKTIEYPYGPASNNTLDTRRLILHHLLFGTDPIVLEEGFILASDEAIRPGRYEPFILTAIKSGQIKVASRYGDMHSYAEERRKNLHTSPPDDEHGRNYIELLQRACISSNAFIDYPSSNIDELTFNRFTKLCAKDKIPEIFDFANADFSQEFIKTYENAYESGNKGRRWTARSAWEWVAKEKYGGRPELVHGLMCIANRERQIVRASAIANVNNVNMKVETGFEKESHELASKLASKSADTKNNSEIVYPKVSIEPLIENSNQLFEALSNPNSPVSLYRNNYVTQLNNIGNSNGYDSLKRIAEDYEREIYNSIGVAPIEHSQPINVAGTVVTGTIIGGALSGLWAILRDKNHSPIFCDEQKKKFARRDFLKKIGCSALMTSLYVLDNKAGNEVTKTIRLARVEYDLDTGDDFLTTLDMNSLSHQILTVNKGVVI